MGRDQETKPGRRQWSFPLPVDNPKSDNAFGRIFGQRSRREALDERQRLESALAQLQLCTCVHYSISGNEIRNQDPTKQGYQPIEMFFPKAVTVRSGNSLTFVPDENGYNQARALMRELIGAMMEVHKRGVVLGAIHPETVYYQPYHPNPVRFLATELTRVVGDEIPKDTRGQIYHPMHSHMGQLRHVNVAVDWWQVQQLMLLIVGIDGKYPLDNLNDEDQSVWKGLANTQAMELIRLLGFISKNAGLPDEAYTVMSVFAKTIAAEATDDDWNEIWKMMFRKVGDLKEGRGAGEGVVVPFRRD